MVTIRFFDVSESTKGKEDLLHSSQHSHKHYQSVSALGKCPSATSTYTFFTLCAFADVHILV